MMTNKTAQGTWNENKMADTCQVHKMTTSEVNKVTSEQDDNK